MIITCKICTTKYSISKNALGKNGKKVKCSNCGNEWYQKLNIEKKKILTETLEKTEVPINYDKKKDNNTSNFFPSEIKKKKSYKLLYIAIPIILILFIYLNKKYFNYEIKNYFLKFIELEFLIKKQKQNSFDLVFNQIEKDVSILNNNEKIIKIFGKISNTSNTESYKIPKLKASLIDNKNNIITTWFFNAEQENLGPQESLNFNTSYIHDNEDIADIKIEFYKEKEEE